MIYFRRDNDKVAVDVFDGLPDQCDGKSTTHYVAYIALGSVRFAHLFAEHLRAKLHKELRDIREEAYNEGWRDAKAHKGGKQTWFSELW